MLLSVKTPTQKCPNCSATIAKNLRVCPKCQARLKVTKSVDVETKERVKKILREIVDKDYGGSVSATAVGLKLSQSMLYELVSGTRGPGMKVVEAIATHTGRSFDDIMGHEPKTTPANVVSLLPPPAVADRYPNRGEAAVMARQLGYADQAIAEVQSIRLKSDTDPPIRYWLDRMRMRDDELRNLQSWPGIELEEGEDTSKRK